MSFLVVTGAKIASKVALKSAPALAKKASPKLAKKLFGEKGVMATVKSGLLKNKSLGPIQKVYIEFGVKHALELVSVGKSVTAGYFIKKMTEVLGSEKKRENMKNAWNDSMDTVFNYLEKDKVGKYLGMGIDWGVLPLDWAKKVRF